MASQREIGDEVAIPLELVLEHGRGDEDETGVVAIPGPPPLPDSDSDVLARSTDIRARIVQKPSPNHESRGGFTPEVIIIHRMQGTLPGTDSWFANPQSGVSAHYGIGQNGEIHQYVAEERRAWHAGTPRSDSVLKQFHPGVNQNRFTIGIEHEGKDLEPWSETMRATSAALIKDIAARWNIAIDATHIVPHRACTNTACPGDVPGMVEDIIRRAQEGGGVVPPPPPPSCVYIVRSGDWLNRIATNHGLTLAQLLDLNPQIQDMNLIFVGQEIRVC